MKPIQSYLTWGLLAVCIGCAAGPSSAPETSTPFARLVDKVQPAVVTIRTFDAQTKLLGLGTGFFVNAEGHLISNHHVLQGAYTATVKTQAGESFPVREVLADNEAVDLIKLAVDIPAAKVRWLEAAAAAPRIAAPVLVVGSPLGLEQTVSEGIISAVREVPGMGHIFQTTAPISQGSSGSPVVDQQGRVVGVVSFQTKVGQNINFAVGAENLHKLEDQPPQTSVAEWTYLQARRKPREIQALCREGFDLAARGNYKSALSYFQEAVAARPEDAEAWFGLGSCYVGLDQEDDAIAAYQQVIRHDPQNANAYYHLGHYYIQLERYGEAVDSMQQALARKADHIPARFELAFALGQLGRPLEEKQALEAIIADAPDFFPAFHRLGIVLNELGQYGESLSAQKAVLALKPDFAPAYFAMGLVYANLGEDQHEADAYKEALRVDPDFTPAHYNLGLFYLRTGSRDRALDEYKILKKLDQDAADRLFDKIYAP
jgi:tetratricopeptide (TPR) repeat protein